MPKYIGQPCTSCRNVFKEGDEIVVCPECGSPYHKDCYKLEGKCINVLLHESGSEWHPEPVITPALPDQTDRVCPNCGTHNSLEAYFCTSCGASLQGDRPARPEINENVGTNQQPFGGVRPEMSPFLNVRTVSQDADVDGNTVGEYAKYVGPSFYYYIPRFLKFAKKGGNMSFNIPAFFFPELWFFYRKMPVYGVLTLIVSLVTSLPSIYEFFMMFSASAAGQVYQPSGLAAGTAFMVIANICAILSWVKSIVCGLFANYIYYRKAKSDIDRIKSDAPGQAAWDGAIAARGGTSVMYVVLAFVATLIVSYALMFIFTLGA